MQNLIDQITEVIANIQDDVTKFDEKVIDTNPRNPGFNSGRRY
jgi:hypothetical protein